MRDKQFNRCQEKLTELYQEYNMIKSNYDLLSKTIPIIDSYSDTNLKLLKNELARSKKELISIYNKIQKIKSKLI